MNNELSNLFKKLQPNNMSIEDQIEQLLTGTVLFGTIIIDTYSIDETKDIYDAMDIVCNRKNYFSFDHYGIYCFWDYYTKEILYIGLSNNLRSRFGQHNGLLGKKGKGNKYKYIKEYFKEKERLGYTLLVQSPYEHNDLFLDDKNDEIKQIEGALIEEFNIKNNRLPKWNDIGGSKVGRQPSYIKRYGSIFSMIVGEKIDFLNARSTLRELSQDVVLLSYESDLNIIRGRMYKYGESFDEAVEKLIQFNNFYYKSGALQAGYSNIRLMNIRNNSYINKNLVLF